MQNLVFALKRPSREKKLAKIRFLRELTGGQNNFIKFNAEILRLEFLIWSFFLKKTLNYRLRLVISLEKTIVEIFVAKKN